ncbi:hypothetical protein RND71_000929 [Anisodus tanguticus]|uniref:Pentatricopeptide repeat-containing protein n=1 Tax=Anisodus tanguticus TaxID=243964 RepID=A0AAE1T1C7_9SOLA|nr:hypothetical protein RND71_000929 [Anisodus tanguticus]
MILEQEPNDPAAHVLLSNLYASRGQWEEVAKIRKDMKEKRLVKEAGCSWIEAENSVHKFCVSDTKHPKAKEIYEKLDKLALKIKEIGYVPNTDLVLHEDYSEEDGKEDAQDEEAQDDDLEDTDEENEACQNSGEDDDFDTDGEDTGNASRWKEFLLERTRERQNVNLMQLVYGDSESKSTTKAELQQHGTENDESDTEFFVPKGEGTKKSRWMMIILMPRTAPQIDWRSQESIESIRIRFVSKGWSKAASGGGSRDVDRNDDVGEDDEDLFGDFEDLETGQKYESHEIGDAGTDNMIRKDDESAVEEPALAICLLASTVIADYSYGYTSPSPSHNSKKYYKSPSPSKYHVPTPYYKKPSPSHYYYKSPSPSKHASYKSPSPAKYYKSPAPSKHYYKSLVPSKHYYKSPVPSKYYYKSPTRSKNYYKSHRQQSFAKDRFAHRAVELFNQMLGAGINQMKSHTLLFYQLVVINDFEQEPNDPAAHVLLSNLYASRGQWKEVAKIRKDMKEKRLVKEAGYSWIEAENNFHKFYVGDTKHLKAKEVYEKLDKVALKIKEIGYVPNTDLVLHEVDDEQK